MKKLLPFMVIGITILGGVGAGAIFEKTDTSDPPVSYSEQYDLVIITSNIFTSPLQPLLGHKNSFGVKTTIKTIESIYNEYEGRDEAEQIKYFIKDAIEQWNISFVLLVGGSDLIPSRYTHIYFEYDYQTEWIFMSDLYFADIYNETGGFSSWDTNENDVFGEYNWYGNTDELDLIPDVYLGRLACINTNEVTICVNKIITYETEEAYAQHWFTNLVLMGGDSLLGDEEHIDEGEYVNAAVIDIMDGFIPNRIWASNGKLYDAYTINDAINIGAGFAFFNGHGNTDLWGTHPHESYEWIPPGFYCNSHLNDLNNGDKLPIVISDACYHCTYDVASDCFGWTFVTNPDGGCIAFLGSTDIDVSYGGEDIVTKGIEKLCLDMSTNYQNGTKTFGELWANALKTYINEEMDEIDYITVEEFQPFGDPSLRIASDSQKPEKPATPEGEIHGKVGVEYTYTTSTTDPEEDLLYYLFDWGDGTYSGWIGPYESDDTAEASHTWMEKGDYKIKVKAKDIHGVQSEWSDPLPIEMPKSTLYLHIHQLIDKIIEGFHQLFILLLNICDL